MLSMTVGQIAAEMDHAELIEWMALSTMEPIGFERDAHLAGHLAQMILTPHYTKPPGLADCMPFNPKRFDDPRNPGATSVDDWIAGARRAGIKVKAVSKDAPE
jgi:hypothetical protein